MMYAGEVPWHRLGTRLDKPAAAAAAIVAAGLDWEVVKRPRLPGIWNGLARSDQNFALVRNDRSSALDGVVLGYVDESYTPLQNREAFEFFDPIVGRDAAVFETAGALGRGQQVWILARLPQDMRVAGDDLVAPYLLLANCHGGNGGVELRFTPVRVVCGNTLSLALHLSRGLRLEHTPDLHARLQQAAWNLDEIKRQYANIENVFTAMARLPMTGGRLSAFLSGVFPTAPGSRDGQRSRTAVVVPNSGAQRHPNGRADARFQICRRQRPAVARPERSARAARPHRRQRAAAHDQLRQCIGGVDWRNPARIADARAAGRRSLHRRADAERR